jgi:hypothetical protein
VVFITKEEKNGDRFKQSPHMSISKEMSRKNQASRRRRATTTPAIPNPTKASDDGSGTGATV